MLENLALFVGYKTSAPTPFWGSRVMSCKPLL